jgi:hypothetical protein
LLPKEQGYWFNLGNAHWAVERYQAFREWSAAYDLRWDGVGLDIEPDIRDMIGFAEQRWRMLPQLLKRVFERGRLRPARLAYQSLVAQMQVDGYRVDSYQFPVIADERQVGSTLLQRVTGLVNVIVDREVWMLYSSFLRPNGVGLIASYAPNAQSVAVGSTGGGVDVGLVDTLPLTWDELGRDLRLAWHYCDDLHIFSLEGCVQRGFLERLRSFTWDYPILLPEQNLARVDGWRRGLRSVLWLSAWMKELLLVMLGSWLLWRSIRYFWKRRNN